MRVSMLNIVPVRLLTTRQCHYCSGWFDARELRTIGENVRICNPCSEKHTQIVDGFIPPDHCQECNTPIAVLMEREPGETFSMFPHWKDGTYQLLCRKCDAAYVPKRRDLFQGTRFAHERNL